MSLSLTAFETSIKNFLDELAQEDELFAKTYAKPNKSIKECCQYIYQQVEKARTGGARCVACEDDEIYGLAIHYYDEDDIEVTGSKAKVEEVQHVETPKKSKSKSKAKPKLEIVPKEEEEDEAPGALIIPLF